MRWYATVAVLLATSSTCAHAARGQTSLTASVAGYARFDWFTYEGHDPIYDSVQASPDAYLNPILEGFYPDPSMVRVGDAYYLVTSSFAYFPGVPIFRSRDLVHWTQIGSVLDRPSQLRLDSMGVSRGIFAPNIRYHAGTYYMITTLADGGGNFLVMATNPAGPWSDPVWLREVDGIDPSLFFDDDGKAYVVNNGPPIGPPLYQGHRALWMQEYDIASHRMVGSRKLVVNGGVNLSAHPVWIEAPHILKVANRYYLIAAEGGTAEQHSEEVFRSDSVWGPWVPYDQNPILTQRQLDPARPFPITSTGHADFVQTPAGEWWAVFLGARPYANDMYNTGRETFLLPVHWQGGWPAILPHGETVPYVHRRPNLPAQAAAAVPTSGNFTVRDDFEGPSLAPYWMFLRTPSSRWYDFTSRPGWLTIRARPVDIGSHAQPSYIGRRQQHGWASASTAMQYTPIQADDHAGLVAFQNEDHYFFLGVALDNGRPVVQVRERAGGAATDTARMLASTPVQLSAHAPVYLRIQARGGKYSFYYGTRPGAWTLLLSDADGTALSTRVAGGFVGVTFGMYAYGR